MSLKIPRHKDDSYNIQLFIYLVGLATIGGVLYVITKCQYFLLACAPLAIAIVIYLTMFSKHLKKVIRNSFSSSTVPLYYSSQLLVIPLVKDQYEILKQYYLTKGDVGEVTKKILEEGTCPRLVLDKNDGICLCLDWSGKSYYIVEIVDYLNSITVSYIEVED